MLSKDSSLLWSICKLLLPVIVNLMITGCHATVTLYHRDLNEGYMNILMHIFASHGYT